MIFHYRIGSGATGNFSALKNADDDMCSYDSGRNGGHLTAHNFMGFQQDVAAWGILEAIKAVHIEEHVTDAIGSLVKSAGIENEVDLVEGVRTVLFFTKEEEVRAYDEYEAAKAAGVNVSAAEWLTESEVEKVRQKISTLRYIRGAIIFSAGIRGALSSGAHPWTYNMASQASHPLV